MLYYRNYDKLEASEKRKRSAKPVILPYELGTKKTKRPLSDLKPLQFGAGNLYRAKQQLISPEQYQISKIKPRKIAIEKERLYEENLSLKHLYNSIKDQNIKLKTRILQMEREIQFFEQRPGSSNSPEAKLVKGLHLISNLKNTIRDLRQQIISKDNEITSMRKNVKATRVAEMEEEIRQYAIECIRLRHLAEEVLEQRLIEDREGEAKIIEQMQNENLQIKKTLKLYETSDFNKSQRIDQLQKLLTQKENELSWIVTVKDRKTDNRSLNYTELELQKARAEIKENHKELEKFREALEKEKKKVNSSDHRLNDQTQRADSQRELDQHRSNNQALLKEVESYASYNKSLQKQLKNLKTMLDSKEEESKKSHISQHDLEKKHFKLEKTAQEMHKSIEDLTKLVNQLQSDKKALEEQVEIYMKEVKSVKTKTSNLEVEVKTPKVRRSITNVCSNSPPASKKPMGNLGKALSHNPQAALFSFYNKLQRSIKQINFSFDSLVKALNPHYKKLVSKDEVYHRLRSLGVPIVQNEFDNICNILNIGDLLNLDTFLASYLTFQSGDTDKSSNISSPPDTSFISKNNINPTVAIFKTTEEMASEAIEPVLLHIRTRLRILNLSGDEIYNRYFHTNDKITPQLLIEILTSETFGLKLIEDCQTLANLILKDLIDKKPTTVFKKFKLLVGDWDKDAEVYAEIEERVRNKLVGNAREVLEECRQRDERRYGYLSSIMLISIIREMSQLTETEEDWLIKKLYIFNNSIDKVPYEELIRWAVGEIDTQKSEEEEEKDESDRSLVQPKFSSRTREFENNLYAKGNASRGKIGQSSSSSSYSKFRKNTNEDSSGLVTDEEDSDMKQPSKDSHKPSSIIQRKPASSFKSLKSYKTSSAESYLTEYKFRKAPGDQEVSNEKSKESYSSYSKYEKEDFEDPSKSSKSSSSNDSLTSESEDESVHKEYVNEIELKYKPLENVEKKFSNVDLHSHSKSSDIKSSNSSKYSSYKSKKSGFSRNSGEFKEDRHPVMDRLSSSSKQSYSSVASQDDISDPEPSIHSQLTHQSKNKQSFIIYTKELKEELLKELDYKQSSRNRSSSSSRTSSKSSADSHDFVKKPSLEKSQLTHSKFSHKVSSISKFSSSSSENPSHSKFSHKHSRKRTEKSFESIEILVKNPDFSRRSSKKSEGSLDKDSIRKTVSKDGEIASKHIERSIQISKKSIHIQNPMNERIVADLVEEINLDIEKIESRRNSIHLAKDKNHDMLKQDKHLSIKNIDTSEHLHHEVMSNLSSKPSIRNTFSPMESEEYASRDNYSDSEDESHEISNQDIEKNVIKKKESRKKSNKKEDSDTEKQVLQKVKSSKKSLKKENSFSESDTENQVLNKIESSKKSVKNEDSDTEKHELNKIELSKKSFKKEDSSSDSDNEEKKSISSKQSHKITHFLTNVVTPSSFEEEKYEFRDTSSIDIKPETPSKDHFDIIHHIKSPIGNRSSSSKSRSSSSSSSSSLNLKLNSPNLPHKQEPKAQKAKVSIRKPISKRSETPKSKVSSKLSRKSSDSEFEESSSYPLNPTESAKQETISVSNNKSHSHTSLTSRSLQRISSTKLSYDLKPEAPSISHDLKQDIDSVSSKLSSSQKSEIPNSFKLSHSSKKSINKTSEFQTIINQKQTSHDAHSISSSRSYSNLSIVSKSWHHADSSKASINIKPETALHLHTLNPEETESVFSKTSQSQSQTLRSVHSHLFDNQGDEQHEFSTSKAEATRLHRSNTSRSIIRETPSRISRQSSIRNFSLRVPEPETVLTYENLERLRSEAKSNGSSISHSIYKYEKQSELSAKHVHNQPAESVRSSQSKPQKLTQDLSREKFETESISSKNASLRVSETMNSSKHSTKKSLLKNSQTNFSNQDLRSESKAVKSQKSQYNSSETSKSQISISSRRSIDIESAYHKIQSEESKHDEKSVVNYKSSLRVETPAAVDLDSLEHDDSHTSIIVKPHVSAEVQDNELESSYQSIIVKPTLRTSLNELYIEDRLKGTELSIESLYFKLGTPSSLLEEKKDINQHVEKDYILVSETNLEHQTDRSDSIQTIHSVYNEKPLESINQDSFSSKVSKVHDDNVLRSINSVSRTNSLYSKSSESSFPKQSVHLDDSSAINTQKSVSKSSSRLGKSPRIHEEQVMSRSSSIQSKQSIFNEVITPNSLSRSSIKMSEHSDSNLKGSKQAHHDSSHPSITNISSSKSIKRTSELNKHRTDSDSELILKNKIAHFADEIFTDLSIMDTSKSQLLNEDQIISSIYRYLQLTPDETDLLHLLLSKFGTPLEITYMKFMLWILDDGSESESVNKLKTETDSASKSLIPDGLDTFEYTQKEYSKHSLNFTSSGPELITESDDFGFILRTKFATKSFKILKECREYDEYHDKYVPLQTLLNIIDRYLNFKNEEEKWLRRFLLEIGGNTEMINYEEVIIFFTGGLPENDNLLKDISTYSLGTEEKQHLQDLDDLKYSINQDVILEKSSRNTSKTSEKVSQASLAYNSDESLQFEQHKSATTQQPTIPDIRKQDQEISNIYEISEIQANSPSLIHKVTYSNPESPLHSRALADSEENSFDQVELEPYIEEEKEEISYSHRNTRISAVSYRTQDTNSTEGIALNISRSGTHDIEGSFEYTDN